MDLTKNPLENAQSLLEDAQANRRRQQKRSDRALLLNLAGQVIGNVLQGRQVEKFNTFMNKKNVMDERAIVRSAVDNAQNVAERARTAASYEGGKDAYFRNELVQTYKASLDTRLAAGVDRSMSMSASTSTIFSTIFSTSFGFSSNLSSVSSNSSSVLPYLPHKPSRASLISFWLAIQFLLYAFLQLLYCWRNA